MQTIRIVQAIDIGVRYNYMYTCLLLSLWQKQLNVWPLYFLPYLIKRYKCSKLNNAYQFI